jgi:hypothetical protein
MSDFELSAAEFRALYDRVKHMSRWVPADRLGALNNISPAQVIVAASSVWRGRAVSLAALVDSAVCEELNRWSFLCVGNCAARSARRRPEGESSGRGDAWARRHLNYERMTYPSISAAINLDRQLDQGPRFRLAGSTARGRAEDLPLPG